MVWQLVRSRKRVRKGITPGDSRSLWKAVNIAKDKNSSEIPSKMFNGNEEIDEDMLPESFSEYFSNKCLQTQCERLILTN